MLHGPRARGQHGWHRAFHMARLCRWGMLRNKTVVNGALDGVATGRSIIARTGDLDTSRVRCACRNAGDAAQAQTICESMRCWGVLKDLALFGVDQSIHFRSRAGTHRPIARTSTATYTTAAQQTRPLSTHRASAASLSSTRHPCAVFKMCARTQATQCASTAEAWLFATHMNKRAHLPRGHRIIPHVRT